MEQKTDPSAVVVPFGKHKGSTVAELLVRDPQYADWLMAQGWLAERFAGLHAAILSRGSAPDDTPEHNAIQVRFLDPAFCAAFLLACKEDLEKVRESRHEERDDEIHSRYENVLKAVTDNQRTLEGWRREATGERLATGPRYLEGPPTEAELRYQSRLQKALDQVTQERENPPIWRLVTSCVFEEEAVDVTMRVDFAPSSGSHRYDKPRFLIEIKPSMGEDFPSVMRQMRNRQCRYLVVGDYQGRSVSLPQLRQMFTANRQTLVMLADIEAELANARRLVEQDVAEALS